MNIVWFKRDCRVTDHEPLYRAAKTGLPTLCLHIIEPDLWKQADLSARQYAFYKESLLDWKKDAETYRIPVLIKVGDALSILKNLHETTPITSLYSHQETWNDWTFQRDKSVLEWAKSNNIQWNEFLQFAVFVD